MTGLKNQLREMTKLIGISSREDEVVRYMYDELKKYSDSVEVDNLGNVTAAFLSGLENPQKILFFAHMDEVGLIVKSVEPDGFLKMERLSAVNGLIIPGTVFKVRTHKGTYVEGVVGAKSHHIMSAEEKNKAPELSSLSLDIGCRSRQEVYDADISEGCVIAFPHHFVEMANNIVSVKSLDDRVGLISLLGLAKHIKGKKLGFDVYITASVQEEFSIRGIMPAARKVDPDISIGIDISPAGDSPDSKGSLSIELGKGPALTYYNYHGRGTLNGIIPNEALVHFLEETCGKMGIPFQREVCRGTLTETAYVSISGEKGVATANISIPTRYTHTPVETACLDDVADAIKLLCGFVDRWDTNINLKKIKI